jgi:hypothetical protein
VENRSEEAAMRLKRFYPLLIVPVLLLGGCAKDMQDLLSQDETRGQAIETLVSDPSMRGEVVAQLLNTPAGRETVFQAILKNEEQSVTLVGQMMGNDRGKALVASQIASDMEMARTFMRMLMLTGVVGEIMTQQQAELLDLGEAFAHGNQVRTMSDLRRLGGVLDGWAKRNEGFYPVCDGYDEVTDCLAKRLPEGVFADLRLKDAWGRRFLYHTDAEGTTYALISYSTDGEYDRLGKAGPTSSYDCDIVFSNGDFVQWPGHIRKETIR